MVFTKFYFAFCLLNLCVFDPKLRDISALISGEAFFLAMQVLCQRPELSIQTANLVRTQHKQFLTSFYRLTFVHPNVANDSSHG